VIEGAVESPTRRAESGAGGDIDKNPAGLRGDQRAALIASEGEHEAGCDWAAHAHAMQAARHAQKKAAAER
jgi:hypothetical protein